MHIRMVIYYYILFNFIAFFRLHNNYCTKVQWYFFVYKTNNILAGKVHFFGMTWLLGLNLNDPLVKFIFKVNEIIPLVPLIDRKNLLGIKHVNTFKSYYKYFRN